MRVGSPDPTDAAIGEPVAGPCVYPTAAIGEPEEPDVSRGAVREAGVLEFLFGDSDLFSGFDKFACAFAGKGRGA